MTSLNRMKATARMKYETNAGAGMKYETNAGAVNSREAQVPSVDSPSSVENENDVTRKDEPDARYSAIDVLSTTNNQMSATSILNRKITQITSQKLKMPISNNFQKRVKYYRTSWIIR